MTVQSDPVPDRPAAVMPGDRRSMRRAVHHGLRREWPTLLLAVLCHVAWVGLVSSGPALFGELGTAVLLVPLLTLYASLQHEMLHGHPFGIRWLDDALVAPAYGVFVPYDRFRVLHLEHHRDESLTDPYEDPESNYLHPSDWQRLSPAVRWVYRANNTLLGRATIGPALGMARFLRDEWRTLRADAPAARRRCARAWLLHALALLPVLVVLTGTEGLPLTIYLLAAFASLGLLRVRTFLEHRAHPDIAGRTVIVESRGPLAFLFLFNSLHAVHHRHPRLSWFRMHTYFRRHRARILAGNGHYVYRSYADVASRYLLRAKDSVPHPLRTTVAPRTARVCPLGDDLVVHSLHGASLARLSTDPRAHDPTAAIARQPGPPSTGPEGPPGVGP